MIVFLLILVRIENLIQKIFFMTFFCVKFGLSALKPKKPKSL